MGRNANVPLKDGGLLFRNMNTLLEGSQYVKKRYVKKMQKKSELMMKFHSPYQMMLDCFSVNLSYSSNNTSVEQRL